MLSPLAGRACGLVAPPANTLSFEAPPYLREEPLGDDDRGTLEAARAQIRERLLGVLEVVERDVRAHRHLRRELQEVVAVLAGEVGDRADRAFLPQVVVGERRDVGR